MKLPFMCVTGHWCASGCAAHLDPGEGKRVLAQDKLAVGLDLVRLLDDVAAVIAVATVAEHSCTGRANPSEVLHFDQSRLVQLCLCSGTCTSGNKEGWHKRVCHRKNTPSRKQMQYILTHRERLHWQILLFSSGSMSWACSATQECC